jgi:4-alpha-glucanotransferase
MPTQERDPWGVEDSYVDVAGREHTTSPETREALHEAMGLPAVAGAEAASEGAFADVLVVEAGGPWRAPVAGELHQEDGTFRPLSAGETVTVPPGYHAFLASHGEAGRRAAPTLLLSSPGRCFAPPQLRAWGWAVQLYAARSRESWGIGDLADLRRLGLWTRRLGGGALLVNPLSAPAPVPPIEASPYFPSSRRFRNPLYARVEEAPGAAGLGARLEALARAGRALDDNRVIDRNAVWKLKSEALEACFERAGADAAFARYRAEQGQALQDFASYCAIAEREGKDWRRWPAPLRRPQNAGVAEFAAAHARRVDYHAFVQWVLDEQLRRASEAMPLIHDLPIGLDVAGADVWCWQDLVAQDASVGAPPDQFNPGGQDWGLTPFIPHRLRAAGYRPFIETIRAGLRHAGGLRIDHVMGLFSLFWIPRRPGVPGAYVRMPADELLAILAIESQRASAYVIGEDLGTVAPGVREQMAAHDICSYRLVIFEQEPPAKFPELALSAVTTHDLPTIAGLWSGANLRHARAAGARQNEEDLAAIRKKLADLTGVAADASIAEVIERVHRSLAQAPSRLVLATLDDALAVEEQPNLPGATAADWPNWARALPLPLEELERHPLPTRIAEAFGTRSRPSQDAAAAPRE